MANKAPNYLKNVLKSVTFSAVDVVHELMPSVKSFTETNREFIQQTYATIRNPIPQAKRRMAAYGVSRVFEPVTYVLHNLKEDFMSGDFYAKEREEAQSDKAMGSMFGSFDFDFDNWDADTSFGDDSTDVTTGDLKIVESIEGTSQASTNTIVSGIARATEVNMKNARTTSAMLFEQQERLFKDMHVGLNALNTTVASIYKLTESVLPNLDKNQSQYQSESLKMLTSSNDLLKQILETQQASAQTVAEKQYAADNKRKAKTTISDLIDYNGMPDISRYFEHVGGNLKDMFSILYMFGETNLAA